MSYDYDVDELELEDETELSFSDDEEGEYGSEYGDEETSFEDIDFEALGIDPTKPTTAKPGSEEKVLMLAARYAAGVPLWHDKDCYDHGPAEALLRLQRQQRN